MYFFKILFSLSLSLKALLLFSLTGSFAVNAIADQRLLNNCTLPDQKALSHVVQVFAEGLGYSSGVVVQPGRVLTVAHALTEQGNIFVEIDGQLKLASPVALSEERDLAVLEVDTGSIKPVPIVNSQLALNEQVWAVGYPLGKSLRTSIGVVTDNKLSQIYSSAHVNSGTSGGALFRCKGNGQNHYELAGIVKAYVADVSSGTAINVGDSVAVSYAALRRILTVADSSRLALAESSHVNNQLVAH